MKHSALIFNVANIMNRESQDKKKKILYVITKSNWGGAQRYVYDLATNFSKKYDVAVVLGGEGQLKTKLEETGIRTIPLAFLKRDANLFADILVFIRLIRIFNEEHPDIIHVNSSKIGGLGSLAGRLSKVPQIIFTAHGWAFREERPEYQKIAIKFLSWLTILFSHIVITVSEKDEREAVAMPFARKKIQLIRNGLSDGVILERAEARTQISKHLKKTNGFHLTETEKCFWIGTIGELHKNKGHSYAIEALSKLPATTNFLFFIIGDGEEKMTLKKQIIESNLDKKVFLLGNRDDASTLLSAFDIFLFPSVKEGLPFAILEAGKAGIPVIASAVGGIPEIITDMQTGILVRTKSADEILHAIEYVFNHSTEATGFGKKLHTKIKKDFSLQRMVSETGQIYNSTNLIASE